MSKNKNFSSVTWPTWPQYGSDEEKAVQRVIKSNQLFAEKEVRRFEKQYANYLGVNHCLGLGNATQGLHLALAALDVGKEMRSWLQPTCLY